VIDRSTTLGPLALRSPLVAASGTIGSVVEFSEVADLSLYGAATAKSVSPVPWEGRPAPRLAPTEAGMLNAIGIQNSGVSAWIETIGPALRSLPVPVWGSAVGYTVDEYVTVAKGLATCAIEAVEVNLSCPNLEGKGMFALDPAATGRVMSAVRQAIDLPIGAKLSPNAVDLVPIAGAAIEAGADFLTLTNTVWGAAIDIEQRRPKLSAGIGGYSGVAIKPIALRCVLEVREAFPDVPIVGLGGVRTGEDVVEYLMAGASAVGIGTAHFERPGVAKRIMREFERWCARHGVESVAELVGAGR